MTMVVAPAEDQKAAHRQTVIELGGVMDGLARGCGHRHTPASGDGWSLLQPNSGA
jgi:hypothetical protein